MTGRRNLSLQYSRKSDAIWKTIGKGNGMKHFFCAVLLLSAGSSFAGSAIPLQWSMIQPGKGGRYEFKMKGNAFELKMKRLPGGERAAAIAVSNVNARIPSQDKLLFSCRGRNANPVKVTLILSYRDGSRIKAPFGPAFSVSGPDWKHYTISLDRDFKLADALYEIRQLKFVANITAAPAGTECGIEVGNIRFSSSEDAVFSAAAKEVIVHPNSPLEKEKRTVRGNALKVYFHLDNEDYNRIFRNRRQMKPLLDNPQYAGFREMLLESVRDQTELVRSPEDADVIVYSSTLADPDAAGRIADAVRKRGIPLFAASDVADPEIESMLPVVLESLEAKGFPERKRLAPSDSALLPDGLMWNRAAFGVYRSVKLRQSGRVLLKFEDGAPAVVEGCAGKGIVVYSTFTLGSALIPDSASYDRFLLQVLSSLSGRRLRPVPPKRIPAEDGWIPGAGEENFGRFGIRLGDGLLVESISNMLTAGKGALEYAFDSKAGEQLLLSSWDFTSANGTVKREINWDWKWSDIGKVQLTSHVPIPAEWKGRTVCFLAEGGIDDLAEVRFNGVLIGKVTKEMPHYWDRPHRYRIAPELIRFGEENTIRIDAENLRGNGGFGKCPELVVVEAGNPIRNLTVDRINWLGKGGVVSDAGGRLCRFDTSLAFPGIRWEVFRPEIHLSLTNLADYAAYCRKGVIRIVDLQKEKTLEADWDEPWLLLFRDAGEFPLLLVFSRKMSSITSCRTGKSFSGFTLRREPEIGMITPLWLTGSKPVDSRGWKNGLPGEIVRKIRAWYPRAFHYPVDCREFFRIEGTRIALKTKYAYRSAESDWAVKSVPYAPISPLAWQMRGSLTESMNVYGTGLITSVGEFALAENTDTARWSLPLPPDSSSRQIPGIAETSKVSAVVNRVFSEGNRWSAGGRTTFQAWTPQYPMGRNFPECSNISLHAWVMGLNQLLNAPFLLTPENRGKFLKRLRIRYFEPVERFRQKAAVRWREEPFSGIRYPIYFSSFYTHPTRYAEGTGTGLDYGDQNETLFVIFSMAQQLADRFGQRDFVQANWNFLKQAARFLLVSDDWGYLASHCRESGSGSMIDMLNCEYAAMLKLARLAEIAGDEELRLQALYRAARRMVPTLARLTFLKFAREQNLNRYAENLAFSVGFKEDGAAYRVKGVPPKAIDLFDMSQGTPEELVELYRSRATAPIEPYLERLREHLQRKKGSAQDGAMADILARMPGTSPEGLRKILTELLNNESSLKRLGADWPGITLPAYVNSILSGIYSAPGIAEARLLNLRDAVYDPVRKTLRILADAIPESRLSLDGNGNLLELTVNGKPCATVPDGNVIRIELVPGVNRIEAKYRK